jgi:nucleoside-diphosphate-sugar epimerase
MRVLITGATGFLGSYLVADLVARGEEVLALVRPGSDLWRLAELRPRLRIIEGSLDDLARLRPILAQERPQAVVHLAWRGVDNLSRNEPMQARNVVAATELAALSAEIGVETFVGAGSHAEYGPYPRAIGEDDPPHPTTLYGMAKFAAGQMAARACSDRVRFAWLRVFSTYGPKDAGSWLIPNTIATLRSGQPMALTECEQRWGFLHARDAAAAFCTVLLDRSARGYYNVGCPDAPRLRETVMTVRDLIDPGARLEFGKISYRPDQVMVLQADIRRLKALGWQPQVALDQGLRETVAWYDSLERT